MADYYPTVFPHQALGRSKLSFNWRTGVGNTCRDVVDTLSETAGSQMDRRFLQRIDNNFVDANSFSGGHASSDTVRGENDPETLRAITEGRRLYVGNMPYFAKVEDVQNLFRADDYEVVHVNMSIDPYTGRNPSYCFIELKTKEQADRAIQQLSGTDILGRPAKLGPGVARPSHKRPRAQHDQNGQQWRQAPIFNRWNRTDAADHWTGYSEKGRRLWVGGLPQMNGHLSVNNGIRELFRGFNVEAVSKVVIPTKPAFGDPGAWNHRYLFVDFSTAEEADRAVKATNGKQAWGVKIRVMPARPQDSRKIGERDAWQHEQDSENAEIEHRSKEKPVPE